MVQAKKSFKERKLKKDSKNSLGKEFAVVIKNDSQYYPQTGQWRDRRPVVDCEKCIGCGVCVANCPEDAICLKKIGEKQKAKIDYQFCKGEGICEQVCPVKAIKMEKE